MVDVQESRRPEMARRSLTARKNRRSPNLHRASLHTSSASFANCAPKYQTYNLIQKNRNTTRRKSLWVLHHCQRREPCVNASRARRWSPGTRVTTLAASSSSSTARRPTGGRLDHRAAVRAGSSPTATRARERCLALHTRGGDARSGRR
jgi:hypothetical protein